MGRSVNQARSLSAVSFVGLSILSMGMVVPAVYGQEDVPPVILKETADTPAIRYPGVNVSVLRHSSTIPEGIYRGRAELTRAGGEAAYNYSLALYNVQLAHRRWIENSVLRLEAYYKRKDMWHDNREKYARKPLTMEQHVRLAALKAPAPLTLDEYDQVSGKFAWPSRLQDLELEDEREAIESSFKNRPAKNNKIGTPTSEAVEKAAAVMKDYIDSLEDRGEIRAEAHMLMAKFLERVRAEAKRDPVQAVDAGK